MSIPNTIQNKTFKLQLHRDLSNKTNKNFELVITRFNENINWSDNFINFRTIYNKGEDDLTCEYIKRPNIGRDGETVIHHILTNWDNLADVTFFTQGAINDRADQIINLNHINNYIKCTNNISYFSKRNDLPNYNNTCTKTGTKTFGEIYEYVMEKKYTQNFSWVSGMWISVHRDVIKSVPIQIYTRFNKLFHDSKTELESRDIACCLERMLLHIFEHYSKF